MEIMRKEEYLMTQNQIAYANLVEQIRHNKATEEETALHNRNEEQIKSDTNALNREYNAGMLEHYSKQDAINLQHYTNMDSETQRSNLASESLRSKQLDNEYALGYGNLKVSEGNLEVNRGQLVVSQDGLVLGWYNADIAQQNADSNAKQAEAALQNAQTNAKNAETRVKELRETKRQNQRDYEVAIRKVKSQEEANRITKAYHSASIIIDQEILDETKRSNEENEKVKWYQAETDRYKAVYGTPDGGAITANYSSSSNKNNAETNYINAQTDWYGPKTESEIARNYGSAVKGVNISPQVNNINGPNLNTPYGYGYYSNPSSQISGSTIPVIGSSGGPLLITGG